jgi:hypothetical protein
LKSSPPTGPADHFLVLPFVLYVAGLYVYRLFFHSLAGFPGPKIAAISLWYEFYYGVIQRGQFIFHIHDLHKKCGPTVRIGPDDLHVNDPEFLPELYPVGGRLRDKYRRVMQVIDFNNAALSTVEHDVHRMRRDAMLPGCKSARLMGS